MNTDREKLIYGMEELRRKVRVTLNDYLLPDQLEKDEWGSATLDEWNMYATQAEELEDMLWSVEEILNEALDRVQL